MKVDIHEVRSFWNANPCGGKLSTDTDRKRYWEEIERKRYTLESHIPMVANFQGYADQDVLEIGCGLGTDGIQFARGKARYIGVDLTDAAVKLSEERFRLFEARGSFFTVNAEKLPFSLNSFDHVYSFGVIHHSPNTEAIVSEIYRVLKPGGSFCVMVYNRSSINYYLEIMFLRKMLRALLYPSFAPEVLSKLLGFDKNKLCKHREILCKGGRMSSAEWLSINTDGPECPLAKVYNAKEARRLFHNFENVTTEVWHFDWSHWSVLGRWLPHWVCRILGRLWGWHRVVKGRKAGIA